MTIEIRTATVADLSLIEALHRVSWQFAYKGMVTDAFLADEVPRIMARKWESYPSDDWIVLLASVEGKAAGFVALDMAHEGGPYVDNLHVAPESHGRGLGRALMGEMAVRVARKGGASIWLTVIRENLGSRAFYRRIGGREAGEQDDDLFGQPIVSVPVHWEDLDTLARLRHR